MKKIALLTALAATFAGGIALAPQAVFAANARAPHTNVNHANDAGNSTGDAETDRLNAAQLTNPGTASVPGATGTADAGAPAPAHTMPMHGRMARHMHHSVHRAAAHMGTTSTSSGQSTMSNGTSTK